MISDSPEVAKVGEPIWELATRYPYQGDWTEEDYLHLTDSWNRLIEFTDGQLEVLPMPTEDHQTILLFLMDALRAHIEPRKLGKVLFSGLRVRIRPDKIREPDLVFIRTEHYKWRGNQYWSSADLVMEIVSEGPGARDRDLQQKVKDYAEAGIAEYWVVDPEQQQIEVLTLDGAAYRSHGRFAPGQMADSVLLAGFGVDVAAVFAAAKG